MVIFVVSKLTMIQWLIILHQVVPWLVLVIDQVSPDLWDHRKGRPRSQCGLSCSTKEMNIQKTGNCPDA